MNAWVDQQLGTPVSPSSIHASSKLATAEALKIQAARERFEQKKELLRLQAELRPQRVPLSRKYRPDETAAPQQPAAAVPLDQDPMLAELRAAREAAATRQLDAALQQASDEMSGEPPAPLPQA